MRIKMCLQEMCTGEQYISLLTQASMRYFEMPFAQTDYDMIVRDLMTFSEADYVFLTVLDKQKYEMVLVGMSGLDKKLKRIESILGFQLMGSSWVFTDADMDWMNKNSMVYVEDLYEATFGQITPFQSKEIHSLLNIGEIYMVGLRHNKEILGNAVLCWKKGRQMNTPERTELFVHLLGTVLLRKQAEEDLGEKENELQMMNEEIKAMNEELEASLEQLRAADAELRHNYDELQKKERALHESEERWKFAFECSEVGVWDWNVQTKAVVYSEKALMMFGYDHEEKVRFEDTPDRFHPEDLKQVYERLEKHFSGENPTYESVHRVRCKDGSYHWILDRGKVVSWTENGKPLRMVGIYVDFTERKKIEDELKKQKQTIDSLVRYSPDGIVMVDKNMRIVNVNSKFTEIFGYTLEECRGRFIDDFVVAEGIGGGYEEAERINEMARMNLKFEVETLRRAKDGRIIPVIIRGSTTIVDGKTVGYHAYYTDISERKEAEEQIKYLSYHDKLTGLFNRAYFEEQLLQLDGESHYPLTIVVGDVNGLKLTNDIFGHMEGDKLLVRISEILTAACGAQGIVARWGGDEFAMILPSTDEELGLKICSDIRKACTQSEEEPIQISIALGSATKNARDENIREIIKEAEEKMYRHKLLESKSTRSNMIASLKKTLFERSHETEEHGERLRKMSLALGRRLGLKDHELDELSLLGILHDIGKIAIPDHILTKPGPLTEEEWIEMKRHPEIGYRIAQASPELFSIAEYILCHHERWDGMGYPQGLKGEEIPMLSRILTIVDAYDAMTSARTYKKAVSHDRALMEILRCAGSQFDPEMALLFVEIMKDRLN